VIKSLFHHTLVETKKKEIRSTLVSAKLTHYLPMVHFRLPWWDSGAIATKIWDKASGTDLRTSEYFQQNPFSIFGRDASQQTDIQTDRQTDKQKQQT